MTASLTACGGSSSGGNSYKGNTAVGGLSGIGDGFTNSVVADTAFAPDFGEVIESNYEMPEVEYNTNEFEDITENRFVSVKTSPLSTFAADVDTASYGVFRRNVLDGIVPPTDAIHIEEMINYFNYDYVTPENGEPFACTTEVIQCPWNPDTLLMSVNIATEKINTSDMPASNLVFLLDVSGSMDGPDRLDLVKRSFKLLCEQLKSNDTISIVTYASSDQVLIDGAKGDEADIIMQAIEELYAGGSTNGSAGIVTAYELAEKHFIEGGNNRVILATDGDLNVGTTSEGELEDLISEKKKSGVFLSVMGFGYGNYKDNKLETLADKGNGNYHYIDSIMEARKALVDDMGGNLLTVAKDVKLQVEFNPNIIKGYRLIGYENRLMRAEDFADDTKDGGELGAGHKVTALYEIATVDSAYEIPDIDLKYQDRQVITNDVNNPIEICTVNIRCKEPDKDESKLWEFPVNYAISENMSDNLRLASAVAQVGMLVRESEFIGTATYENVIEQLKGLAETDALVDEFIYLVERLSRMG